jgi:hypothetical protein
MTFNSYIHALAKYEPAIKASYVTVLSAIFAFVLWVCLLVMYAHDLPPGYKEDALFSIVMTLISVAVGFVLHDHPSGKGEAVACVASFFSASSCFQMFRAIYGEMHTCSKLYKNLPALDALSSRLDELGSAGSVVSVDLLSAEATETISHYSGLCLKLHAGDGAWYTAHMAVLWVIGITCVLQFFTTVGFTVYNSPGAMRWLREHAHATMHMFAKDERAIKDSIEREGKHLLQEVKDKTHYHRA